MFYLFFAPRCFQSRPKHFAVCLSVCTLDLPYYTGMDTFQQQRLKPFELVFFIFLLLHCTHTHTHFQHFQNMHKTFINMPIILLDLRHLIRAFFLMLNNPFNSRANMSEIISKLPSIIALKLH